MVFAKFFGVDREVVFSLVLVSDFGGIDIFQDKELVFETSQTLGEFD
jgi:hypothetical protein